MSPSNAFFARSDRDDPGVVAWTASVGVIAGLLLAAGFMTVGGVEFRWAWSHYVPRRLTPEDASPSLR
jgi:hypothetical protein